MVQGLKVVTVVQVAEQGRVPFHFMVAVVVAVRVVFW
jgi:hypothetical protein